MAEVLPRAELPGDRQLPDDLRGDSSTDVGESRILTVRGSARWCTLNLASQAEPEIIFGTLKNPPRPKVIRYDQIDRAARKVLKKFQEDPRLFGQAWVQCWEAPSAQAAMKVMTEMRAGVFASTPTDKHVWLLRIHAKRKVFVACVKPKTEDMTLDELKFLQAHVQTTGRLTAHAVALKEDIDRRMREEST